MGAPRHRARLRDAVVSAGREVLRRRTPLALTVIAAGDRPNLAMCLVGPNRLCRQVRGIGLLTPGTAQLRRVRGATRRGDGFVWLSVDLPHEVFAEPTDRSLEVFGWRGLLRVLPGGPGVVSGAATLTSPLAPRWDIRLGLDEHGRVLIRAHQSDDVVTAHELLMTGDRLQVAWEHAAMVRELRLVHDRTGVVLTAGAAVEGLRAVAGVHLGDLCAPGPGSWTVRIGEPGGPWTDLVQDRALESSWMAARPLTATARASNGRPVLVRPGYSPTGALALRVDPCGIEPAGPT